MQDVLSELGPIFLGSRLKRLGERMQAGAGRMIADAGLPVQPAHMPLLAALDGGTLSIGELTQAVGLSQPGVTRGVGQLIKLGLVQSDAGEDQRQRRISLTPAGRAAMMRVKLLVFPRVGRAAEQLCGGRAEELLALIAQLEVALAEEALDSRAARQAPAGLTIREFSDELAGEFKAINTEWIEAMFSMEGADAEVLDHPRSMIVDPGGAVLFVEAEGVGILGTCALRRTGDCGFELTKMGVREAARGLKAGEFLLAAAIERARALGADPLYLLTNSRCAAAIHLYEKAGFVHDADIMARYGARYARCDVAMRYRWERG